MSVYIGMYVFVCFIYLACLACLPGLLCVLPMFFLFILGYFLLVNLSDK